MNSAADTAADLPNQPEWRRDPLRGHWTIIAPRRAARPHLTAPVTAAEASGIDPFLAGHEHLTPVEEFALPAQGGEWSTRVVPNKYPALTADASPTAEAAGELLQRRPATGQQEVIVECPHHETELARLSVDQTSDVVSTWQQRIQTTRQAGRFDYCLIFKNSGARAGASIPHAHSQLVAMSLVPDTVTAELDRARRHAAETASVLQDSILQLERDGGRHVMDGRHVAAFCPFASRFSGETWIAPLDNVPFTTLPQDRIRDIAETMHRVLNALLREHAGAAYNVVLLASPFSVCEEPWFRWRIEICPRLAEFAGFEIATGCYINSVPPERAAAALRRQIVV